MRGGPCISSARCAPKPLLASLLAVTALAGAGRHCARRRRPGERCVAPPERVRALQAEGLQPAKRPAHLAHVQVEGAGYPLKVAIIGSRQDLGGAPQFFANPQGYAKFLGQELSVFGPTSGRTLRRPAAGGDAAGIRHLPGGSESGRRGEDREDPVECRLERAREGGRGRVPKVATAAGHPVAAEKPASGCTKKGTSFLVFLAPIVVLLIGGLLLRYGLRPRPRAETASPDGDTGTWSA